MNEGCVSAPKRSRRLKPQLPLRSRSFGWLRTGSVLAISVGAGRLCNGCCDLGRRALAWILLCTIVLLALAGPAAVSAETLQPGNYCASCHTASDPALARLSEWQAQQPDAAPCPAVKAYREELLYTEQLLTATERAGEFAGSRARWRSRPTGWPHSARLRSAARCAGDQPGRVHIPGATAALSGQQGIHAVQPGHRRGPAELGDCCSRRW